MPYLYSGAYASPYYGSYYGAYASPYYSAEPRGTKRAMVPDPEANDGMQVFPRDSC